MTDQPKDEKSDTGSRAIKSDKKPEQINEIDAEVLCGNIALLPVFKSEANVPSIKTEIENESNPSEENGDPKEPTVKSVWHKGCFIDVEKLLDQLARSEKAREKTEELLVELRKNNTELKSSSTKAKQQVKDLEKEVKNCGRLLNDAEQSLSVTNVSEVFFFVATIVL